MHGITKSDTEPRMTSSDLPPPDRSIAVPPRPVLTARERLAPPSPEPGREPPRKQRKDNQSSRHAAREAGKRRAGGRFRWIGRLIGALAGLIVLGGLTGVVAIYAAYRHYASDLPDLEGLRVYQPRVMSRVYAADGQIVSELATERRVFVPFSAIPDIVKKAFVSAEDQHFWTHPGVDPVAMFRAAVTDLNHLHDGKRPIGASTITQQVAKNMVLTNEVSIARKIKEAILALRIEESLSKQRILELYLNEIYLGQGAYGVAAAAQAYFNKPLDEITIPEAAFLAALPKAPNNYNPFRYPDVARGRRDWVLDRMAEDHAITREQAAEAKQQPVLPTAFHRPEGIPGAGYFAEEVRRKLVERFGADTTTQGGLSVRTSLDPALQTAADQALHRGLLAYDQSHGGWRGPVAHLEENSLSSPQWESELAKLPRPAGMLRNWRLAVVMKIQPADASLAWTDPPASPLPTATPAPVHHGMMQLADTKWARPVKDGKLGGVPRRMNDVVSVGDVVMVEVDEAALGSPVVQPAASSTRKTPATQIREVSGPALHVRLRQIPNVQGALVSLDPRSGRILAMSGGWSFETSQFNRATQANRQPGSSFKPFVYLTALEQGIAPGQTFLDAPFVMNMGAAGVWRPNNYEMTFSGPVPLSVALQKSLNLVTLRVAQKVGMEAVAKTAMDFHLVESMPKVLPAALGAVDTTVLREAGAYASLAQGGRLVTPHLIDSVQDRDGHVIWKPEDITCENCTTPATPPATSPSSSAPPAISTDAGPVLDDKRNPVADAMSTFQIVTMMENVVAHGTGYQASIGMGGRPIAGKTGTTQDFVDAWFGGFTPTLVTIVWIGFDNPTSLGEHETGGALAAPVWREYMSAALKDHPMLQFPMPEGMTLVKSPAGWDALKPGQPDGGAMIDGGSASGTAQPGDSSGSGGGSGGLDTGMGGLY
ncbi:Multimodular transpeptidase-transglycosylase PBP 1A [Granulibacter bethesdensis]|uniref:Penicillin-binding protein 1A n=2 Tax=Granulibacter bethesdensis TaxID=364410 RepID=A0AAN0VEV4_9PROT|nr:Multimodular transpeptidase-transglycosylase PBP 1A [Granulibacter bethesdensis]APH58576.1 Multimodular transpeptidase-transglycosylase PBP 1A [Granulibacter bethesdensis]